jgi:hypothetical protein
MRLAVREYDKYELLNEVCRYAVLKRRESGTQHAVEVDAVHRGKKGLSAWCM